MKSELAQLRSTSTLLNRLIDSADLVNTVRSLPAQTFSALVRHIGIEDAGEIIAVATTDQLVAAFDEDLFVNDTPGEAEKFDAAQFSVWLEVLLEAGDAVAARRIAELSDDFVAHALSTQVLVLDHDELQLRLTDSKSAARKINKSLENSLSEELDGYLLISKRHEGWDAVLSLLLALDRDHHSFLSSILERCAEAASDSVEDLDELSTLISSEDALAEDAEAEREERRSQLGFVEARAARNFLELARRPITEQGTVRDPVSRAYFRELKAAPSSVPELSNESLQELLAAITGGQVADAPALPAGHTTAEKMKEPDVLIDALQALKIGAEKEFGSRLQELAYLSNVLIAGAGSAHARFQPADAAEAAMATVLLGAELMARTGSRDLREVLSHHTADLLFRTASSRLMAEAKAEFPEGFLRSSLQVKMALRSLGFSLDSASKLTAG